MLEDDIKVKEPIVNAYKKVQDDENCGVLVFFQCIDLNCDSSLFAFDLVVEAESVRTHSSHFWACEVVLARACSPSWLGSKAGSCARAHWVAIGTLAPVRRVQGAPPRGSCTRQVGVGRAQADTRTVPARSVLPHS